jgi:D-alanyl-D-alanine carboxypeptidase (penicillin-binding protein 5/6)
MMNARLLRYGAAFLLAASIAMMAVVPKAEEAGEAARAAASSASAMALIECSTGTLLAGMNENARLPMASTTKIMTALVVLENTSPDDLVKIPDEAVGAEGSSIYLRKGEEMTVRDLLYGLMLASGNDAAIALAIHTAGSVPAFADMMNARAAQMGLASTHFITPNGLHNDEHLTTAYELCLIAAEAIKTPLFREIVSTEYYEAQSGGSPRTFKNKNSLLWTYDGAFGVKTGYTSAAGRCLVFGAEREGMTVIGAVLNCRPMFETAAELMDIAFDSFAVYKALDAEKAVFEKSVENCADTLLEVRPKDSIIDLTEKGYEPCYRLELDYFDLRLPIIEGDTVGIASVFSGDELIGATQLVAANTVKRRGFDHWFKYLASFFAA